MRRVDVADLATRNVSGLRANVRDPDSTRFHGPLYRTLNRVYWKTVKGVRWLYVEWDREGEILQAGRMLRDCGYSARSERMAHDWEIEVESLEEEAWAHEECCAGIML